METSWFQNKIVLCGPFVGDINSELLVFRPFVNWLQYVLNTDNIVVSTHYNRSFLYNIKNFPIFKQYTKDENSQYYHRHKKINSKDYGFITNEIKEQISKELGYNKGDVVIYNLGYSVSPKISNTQKIHRTISDYNTSNNVTYIPHYSRSFKELNKVFQHLNKFENVDLIGDKKTKLQDYNHLFENDNYYEYVYEFIIGKILSSKLVICPLSHWTYICNLHNVPVFSWGNDVGIYKHMYRFGNSQSRLLPFSRKNNINIIFNSLDKFMEELC